MTQDVILALDLASKENARLAREIRALGVYSEIHPLDITAAEVDAIPNVKGAILNGGPNRVVAGAEIDVAQEIYNYNVPVLLALSGGVDSSVAAALLDRAVGSHLTCVFVDHGLLRKDEGDEVEQIFGGREMKFIRVNAEERFLPKLAGEDEPERKRKIIGEEFIRAFEEEAKKICKVDSVARGTIYPDVIESGAGNAAVIKSHHNVGGLLDYVDFKEILEPLRLLFKDEVLDRVSSRIVNEVTGVNRVLYDVTSKPPATIEFE